MELDELKKALRRIVADFPNSYTNKIKSIGDLYDDVLYRTSWLDFSGIKFMTRLYCVLNDIRGIDDVPKCLNEKCGKSLAGKNVKNLNEGYRKYCCGQCAKDSTSRKELYI